MKHKWFQTILILGVAAAAWLWSGEFQSPPKDLVAKAEAVIGRPRTPVSYAGVARRTTVRVARRGVNMGGPVNRVGRW